MFGWGIVVGVLLPPVALRASCILLWYVHSIKAKYYVNLNSNQISSVLVVSISGGSGTEVHECLQLILLAAAHVPLHVIFGALDKKL